MVVGQSSEGPMKKIIGFFQGNEITLVHSRTGSWRLPCNKCKEPLDEFSWENERPSYEKYCDLCIAKLGRV